MSEAKPTTPRARMRAQGLKPITIWVPDVDSPEFAAEGHRQSLLVADGPDASEAQALFDSIRDFGPESVRR